MTHATAVGVMMMQTLGLSMCSSMVDYSAEPTMQ